MASQSPPNAKIGWSESKTVMRSILYHTVSNGMRPANCVLLFPLHTSVESLWHCIAFVPSYKQEENACPVTPPLPSIKFKLVMKSLWNNHVSQSSQRLKLTEAIGTSLWRNWFGTIYSKFLTDFSKKSFMLKETQLNIKIKTFHSSSNFFTFIWLNYLASPGIQSHNCTTIYLSLESKRSDE